MRVKSYIEPKAVQRAVDRAAPKTLREAGAYVRAVAKNAIRVRKNRDKASTPGAPPHGHPDSRGSKGFKKTILFGVTNNKQTVVVGPKYVKGGLSNIGRLHEFGGTRKVRSVDPEKFDNGVKIGEKGPVTMRHFSKSRDTIVRRDSHNDPATGRPVVWIRVRTKTQAEHSSRLYRRMARKYAKKVMAKYPARPYMGPALERSTPKLSGFWRNSVKP